MNQSRRQLVYAAGLALLAVADLPENTVVSGWMTIAALVAVGCTLGRLRHPAVMVLIGFFALFAADVIAGLTNTSTTSTFGHAVTLAVLVYALCRHARWRDVGVTLSVATLLTVLGEAVTHTPEWALKLDDGWIWVTAAIAGVAVRYRSALHDSRAEQIRSEERTRIARDLHDVVAHHVSAISLYAEGATAVLNTDVERARDALGAIHGAAASTLTEMRRMVYVLRDEDTPGELSPYTDIKELEAELNEPPHPIPVVVTIDDSIHDVPAFTTSAVLRIAIEAVTNARRHSNRATTIDILIERTLDVVTLVVDDDGEHQPGQRQRGYGIEGMTERASLLGGTLTAGPREGRGWRVHAAIPIGGTNR